jgi:hypothetical protein
MHEHLLGPMGVASAPASLGEAVTTYRAARVKCERRLRTHVSRCQRRPKSDPFPTAEI